FFRRKAKWRGRRNGRNRSGLAWRRFFSECPFFFMRCILAVDSGGTKCEAALIREDGVALGWGLCREPGLNGRSRIATRKAAGMEMWEIATAGIGALPLARFSRQLARGVFDGSAPLEVCEHVVGEWEAALQLAGCEAGIVAVAG